MRSNAPLLVAGHFADTPARDDRNAQAMLSLSEIKARVSQLARQLHAEEWMLPTYGVSADSARPHIECKDASYCYVVVERGQESSSLCTPDIDELLYWVFADMTHELAFAYELKNRVGAQDCRRQAFTKQLELLGNLEPTYARRRATEIAETLALAPFRDNPSPHRGSSLRASCRASAAAWMRFLRFF